jgi:hypothetical protein
MIALSEALISRVEESGLDTVTVPLAILSIWGRQKAGRRPSIVINAKLRKPTSNILALFFNSVIFRPYNK